MCAFACFRSAHHARTHHTCADHSGQDNSWWGRAPAVCNWLSCLSLLACRLIASGLSMHNLPVHNHLLLLACSADYASAHNPGTYDTCAHHTRKNHTR